MGRLLKVENSKVQKIKDKGHGHNITSYLMPAAMEGSVGRCVN